MARLIPETPERFWRWVDRSSSDGCWPYRGTKRKGYGRYHPAQRKPRKEVAAHRWAWTLEYGPIPEGMEPDHRCHTRDKSCPGGVSCPHRACCRPSHLELLTHRDNVLRGRGLAAGYAKRDRCANGHRFTEANTYRYPPTAPPSLRGTRRCRKCVAAAQRRRKQRLKASAN